MGRPLQQLQQFFRELKRRNVYKVAVAYVVVAFVGLQAVDLLIPATTLPAWADAFLLAILIIGFPIALVVAWAFELTPEGVRRTPEAEPTQEGGSDAGDGLSTGYKLLVGLGLVGAAVAGGWYLTGGGDATVSDRSVAVLPFEAQGQQEAGPFTAGMHAALSSRLGNVSALRVSPSRAVQAFEDTALSTAEIAGELGVAWVVSGHVQTTEDEVQVIVELVDPKTGTQRWSDEYTRDLTTESLFDLQSEISREIAASLEAELTPEERERIDRRPTEDLDAYKLYVRGRRQLDSRTEGGLLKALDYFQRAIARDSTYALAWSGLADAVGLFEAKDYASSGASLPDHERVARRALELGPDLAEAHASMGLVHFHQFNGPAALREFRRAVELKPSYAQAHHWLALMLLEIGRLKAGHEHVSLAVQLNPRHASARAVLVWASIAQRNLKAAQTHLQRLSGTTEGRRRELEGLILYHARRWDELETLALGQLEEEGIQRRPLWHFYLTRIAALRGDTAVARDHLAAIREEETYLSYFLEGLANAALGETDAAFAAWETDELIPGRHLHYYYSDIWDRVRDDPRYEELIRRVNEQWGLNPDGTLPEEPSD